MVTKQRFIQLVTSVILLVIAQTSFALQTLTASIDRNPVMVNEAFVLTIEADDSVSTNDLDTSALLSNFVVGRTSSGSSMQMINGTTTRTTTWTIVLAPRTQGKIRIPAFTIDGVSSNPIDVNVVEATQSNKATQQNDAFLEVEIDDGPFYPQQTFRYTLSFYYATAIQSGQLSEPVVEGALVEKVDNDVESSEIINGKRYKVFTRYYAITPQKLGEFTIQPVQLQGEQVAKQNRRSFFSSLATTKPITLFSEPVNFTVIAPPENLNASWLPVELLNLHEEWQPVVTEYTVGEPITRTITLTALGARAEQLPELEVVMPAGVKAYPETPDLNTMNREGRVIGQRKETLAIIPTQPGTITFPEIKVSWFNIKTKQQEVEVLPSKIITVTGAAPQSAAPVNQAINDIPTTSTEQPINDVPLTADTSTEIVVWRALTAFFALAWIITLLIWWQTKRKTTHQNPLSEQIINDQPSQNTEVLWQQFSTACANQEGNIALIRLLDWAKQRLPNQHFQSAEDFAKRLQNPALLTAIQEGQRALYSSNPSQFNWQALPRLLKAAIDAKRENTTSSKLPPLNP